MPIRRFAELASGLDVLAFALIVGGIVSCQTYRALPPATIERGSARQYAKLRVMMRDGSRVEIVRAVVRRDSVVGFTPGKESVRRLAFAHDQVVLVESNERDVGAALRRATLPPPDDENGASAGSDTCPIRTNGVCVGRPAPDPK